MESLILTDVKTKKPSYTVTAFVVGFFIVNLKLIISGITIGGIQMSEFTGVDYAASVAALGSIYVLRKNSTIKKDAESEKINNSDKEE